MAPRTKVNRIDGASVDPTGFHFKRIGVMRANIRRGYQVEMLPYPRDDGKWLVRVVKPKRGNVSSAEVDSYFEIIAKNQEEAEAFIKKDGLWGGALAERVAARIGKRGEAHAVRRLAPGGRVVEFSDRQDAGVRQREAVPECLGQRCGHSGPTGKGCGTRATTQCGRLLCLRGEVHAWRAGQSPGAECGAEKPNKKARILRDKDHTGFGRDWKLSASQRER